MHLLCTSYKLSSNDKYTIMQIPYLINIYTKIKCKLFKIYMCMFLITTSTTRVTL